MSDGQGGAAGASDLLHDVEQALLNLPRGFAAGWREVEPAGFLLAEASGRISPQVLAAVAFPRSPAHLPQAGLDPVRRPAEQQVGGFATSQHRAADPVEARKIRREAAHRD